jgi:hypothetical protein
MVLQISGNGVSGRRMNGRYNGNRCIYPKVQAALERNR